LLPMIVARESFSPVYVRVIDSLVFIFGTLSVCGFYFLASIEARRESWLGALFQVPLAFVVGVGLSLSNSIAILEAILSHPSEFQRTPKRGGVGNSLTTVSRKNRPIWRSWLGYLEFGLFVYFGFSMFEAVVRGYFAVLPFLGLFLIGFGYYLILSLHQRFRGQIYWKGTLSEAVG